MHLRPRRLQAVRVATLFATAALAGALWPSRRPAIPPPAAPAPIPPAATLPTPATDAERIAVAAMAQVGQTVGYSSAYVQLDYPGGDVPLRTGVCTDVVIRALRAVGVDLQQLIHEDMRDHFAAYPRLWGLSAPDANIDHRRVQNIATYLRRQGKERPVTRHDDDYLPGDIVTWRLSSGPAHIGVVSLAPAGRSGRYLMVHNIGAGTQLEDCLFQFEATGHYRWF